MLLVVVFNPTYGSDAALPLDETTVTMTVIYPQVRQPFLKLYRTIANGVAEGYAGPVKIIELSKQDSAQVTSAELSDQIVVALGGRPVKEFLLAQLDYPLVAGAVSQRLDAVHGLSMIPDAQVVASRLQVLAPSTETVYVVVSPDSNITDLRAAQIAFNQLGVRLQIKDATDVRHAAGIYRQLTAELGPGEAIWILPGDRFVNNALLSILLGAAWKSDFVVFSSNPTHVKRGALFSIYPDNFKMGVRLGQLAREIVEGSQKPAQMESLRSVFVTVNERTSNHLGIILTDDMKQHIDLVLPAR
jgi:putative ABC transport system substrate-binding protein